MKKFVTALTVVALGLSANTFANEKEVYTWKKGATNVYSDTPNGLRLDKNNNKMNVRSQSVIRLEQKPITPPSLAEQQAELNKQIAAQNKDIEAQNAKIQAENARKEQEAKAANCEASKRNRQFAEQARNKDDLIPRYDADIAKYCN